MCCSRYRAQDDFATDTIKVNSPGTVTLFQSSLVHIWYSFRRVMIHFQSRLSPVLSQFHYSIILVLVQLLSRFSPVLFHFQVKFNPVFVQYQGLKSTRPASVLQVSSGERRLLEGGSVEEFSLTTQRTPSEARLGLESTRESCKHTRLLLIIITVTLYCPSTVFNLTTY